VSERKPKWPEYVVSPKGVAPGEARLVRKVTGQGVDQLEAEDQMRAMSFAALVRLHRNHDTNELDIDPAILWEAAEWIEVRPAEEVTPTPPIAAS
jgi:hypothetical protein